MPITINGSTGISGVDGSAGTPALQGGDTNTGISFGTDVVIASTGGTERARVDSSGRLLVGTSTARSNFFNSNYTGLFQVEGANNEIGQRASAFIYGADNTTGPILALGKHRSSSIGGSTVVASGDEAGVITFQGADGTEFVEAARITGAIDGTPGTNDMPGRLVFSTTADGASSPTEAMRINSVGEVLIGRTTRTNYAAEKGIILTATGAAAFTRDSNPSLLVARLTNDGELVTFWQANVQEGAISVSGTTVTYGGGHLARWSQLLNNEDPSPIPKGTIMSNLDEMCDWGEEDNEQLNKTKVSDVEGDPNVAGVFVSTSFSDDGLFDFFVAMTGDMVIRIAEGVTVERGDLLMSAGDGTAKPQDDDIIRSKTIAKVTSTNVSCTYDDGSYCVPCVLMAC